MQTKAGQYAEEFGLRDHAISGRGREFTDSLLQTAFRRISQQGIQTMTDYGSKMINSGMQFSGVAESKLPSMIAAGMYEQGLDAERRVWEQEESFKNQAAMRWIDILQHEDNYAMREREMENMQGDIWDTVGTIGSIVAML